MAATETLCSFEAVELLRFDQGLSRDRASAVLVQALVPLVAGDPVPR